MLSRITFKIIVATAVFAVNLQGAVSQNLEATYTETKKMEGRIPDEPDPRVRELVKNAGTHIKELQCSAGNSLYKEKPKEMEEGPEHKVVIRFGDDDMGSVYKNLKSKQIVKQVEFFGRTFIIKEDLNPINWKLEQDQKMVGTYNCRKATAVIDSLNVSAWFSPDIPLNDGPDIFWGLPGLILEVDINNGGKTIVANSVKITNNALAIELPQRGKEVSQQEFNAIKKEKMSEIRRTRPDGSPDRVEIRVVH
jgi:GLPGLI family protein